MSESNNVKFVEDNGQWLWKRYDAQGSVIFRSQYFNTEREAREDYDLNGGESSSSEENTSADIGAGEATIPVSPEQTQETESAPEAGPDINGAGTADDEESQQVDNDNSAGSASL